MIKKTHQYILHNQLFSKKDKLLVAVSGGVDSMVLCYVLAHLEYDIAFAHCNYQLRGDESEGDQQFVENYAEKMGVKCHTKRFDTEVYARARKIGIQEAARDLRYEWFDTLRQTFDYQWVITAHHASDSVETVLFNFAKGTGLRGLKGILPKNNTVVRPLLWATKNEIKAFAETENIAYRDDSSNFTDKYTRNFIRFKILPQFKILNPDFENTARQNINRINEAQVLLDFFMDKIKLEIAHTVDNQYFIHRNKLAAYPSVSTILYEILRDFGFNNTQVEEILFDNKRKTKTGTKYYSADFELLIDRDFFIVQKKETNNSPKLIGTEGVDQEMFFININDLSIEIYNSKFEISHIFPPNISILKTENTAQFDFDSLSFPLKLRRWKAGDVFQPFGMKGKKQKVSDYFTHHKFSDFEKRKTWILETAKAEICWIVGGRTDHRFRINTDTKHCFSIIYT